MNVTSAQIAAAPKVVLHDHLDGGLRPNTVVDLANDLGHALPTTDPGELAAWFHRGANRRDLALYLECFAHTAGVMQTVDGLTRVARECAEDLAADGVVYAEVRFAPELHTELGLSLDAVVEAVLDGFRQATAGTDLTIGTLVTALRTAAVSRQIAELGVRHRDAGVVGFDIAGREKGFPPTLHLDAFHHCQRENFHITIHAGEAFGLPSIWEAIQYCGAERLGHGIRIVDDITIGADGAAELGRLAQFIRDRRVPLEVCPTSNVHTGVCDTVAEHPFDLLKRLRFRVTVNTDNRLMSNTSMTGEMRALVAAFDYGLRDLEWLTINGMKSAFWPFEDRLRIIDEIIKPGYAALARGSAPEA